MAKQTRPQKTMSKNGIDPASVAAVVETITSIQSKGPEFYESPRGVKIKLKKMNAFIIDRIVESNPVDPVPEYVITTVAGKEERHPLTKEVADNPKTSPEDREAYYAWEEKAYGQAAKQNRLVGRALMLLGTDVNPNQDESWKKEQAFLGITIPEDENELKIHFIETVLLNDPTELMMLIMTIMENTDGIDSSNLSAVRAAFQS